MIPYILQGVSTGESDDFLLFPSNTVYSSLQTIQTLPYKIGFMYQSNHCIDQRQFFLAEVNLNI